MCPAHDRRASLTRLAFGALLLASAASACRPAAGRQYQLQGQILAVDSARQELTIKHQDIPGFMPGMTMAFKVGDPRLMEGRTAGELVTATLVVNDSAAHLAAIARTGFAAFESTDAPTRVMDLIQPGDPARDAALVDQTGSQRRLADWRGRVVAVTFVYTRCPLPDFCPLMDRHFKTVQSRLKEDRDLRDAVQLLSVSVDPEYDTPAVLAARATELGADPAVWQFLTGERDQLDAFAAQFGVSVVRKSPAPADILHNIRTAILDGNGRLVATLSGTAWAPADLMTEIRRARAKR